jgi:hypothetical protein
MQGSLDTTLLTVLEKSLFARPIFRRQPSG